MRERAALFGGTLSAAAHGRGWRVTAVLPLADGAAVADVAAS
jgi:signal transduction histidine kinase